jgi:hypothetical protein
VLCANSNSPLPAVGKLVGMSDSTGPASPEERLESWREEMSPVLARLEAFELPADFPFDFSAASLARLEQLVLDRFPAGRAPAEPAGGFLEAAIAYIGESLLRTGGGQWDWDAEADVPLVRPDEALKLPSISPLRLIIAAAGRRTGTELAGAHAELAAAVDEHAAAHPGWSPTKVPTPGVDEVGEPAASPWLAAWLAERERAFPAWAAGSGVAPASWDFSPASVDALEALVRRRLPATGALTDAAHHDFAQGAAWYYGEVARRNKTAARWRYSPGVPGSSDIRESYERNPYVGRPYIDQPGPEGDSLVPILVIEVALMEDEPGFMASRLNALA